MPGVSGLHHVTAIAADPQQNLDFYVGLLGMRLVKRSVNQDVPDTYHLFYADAEGHPGTDLTFFPWPDMLPGQNGVGLAVEVSLAVPAGSLDFWQARLAGAGAKMGSRTRRFGEEVLPLSDPHGLQLTLTETGDARWFTPWVGGPVPAEKQVRGLHTVRLRERELGATGRFLSLGLGFLSVAEDAGWHRYAAPGGGSGTMVDVMEAPDERRGRWGPGTVHHVAWRVSDPEAQLRAKAQVEAAGATATEVIDRFWFKSIYFKEPGGVLFEIATDGPGFATDEPVESLGTHLVLPPWLEPSRAQIEKALPELKLPG